MDAFTGGAKGGRRHLQRSVGKHRNDAWAFDQCSPADQIKGDRVRVGNWKRGGDDVIADINSHCRLLISFDVTCALLSLRLM
ncbi:hypothetical protein D9M71_727180 [compost metagenome]